MIDHRSEVEAGGGWEGESHMSTRSRSMFHFLTKRSAHELHTQVSKAVEWRNADRQRTQQRRNRGVQKTRRERRSRFGRSKRVGGERSYHSFTVASCAAPSVM
eukprot:740739-Rhodomonas_salina.2